MASCLQDYVAWSKAAGKDMLRRLASLHDPFQGLGYAPNKFSYHTLFYFSKQVQGPHPQLVMGSPGETMNFSEASASEEEWDCDLDGCSDVEDQFFSPVDIEWGPNTAPAAFEKNDIRAPGERPQLYQYSKLEKETQFRLLVLKARNDRVDDSIQCELRIEDLSDAACPEYEALSYTWGDSADFFKVWIEGRILRVTQNLRDALQSLRYSDRDRLLWIDAICINQSAELHGRPDETDFDEKSVQVRQMGSIYKKAASLVIWLGPTETEHDQLFQFLEWSQANKDELKYLESRWSHWRFKEGVRQSLKRLLRHPWFKRVWIVQEVALSRSGQVRRGEHYVPAHIFAQLPSSMEVKPEPHCQQILNIMPGIRIWDPPHMNAPQRNGNNSEGTWVPRQLRTLLRDFKDSEATQPVDKIYALLGLSTEQGREHQAFALHYSNSQPEVVRNTIATIYPELSEFELPSWELSEFWTNLDTLENVLFIWAARGGRTTMFKRLLEMMTSRCDFFLYDDDLRGALSSALERRRPGIVAVIAKTGRLDINLCPDEGNTPLDIAMRDHTDGHYELMFFLLGADIVNLRGEKTQNRLFDWWLSVVAHWRVSRHDEVKYTRLITALRLLIDVGMRRLQDPAENPFLAEVMSSPLSTQKQILELLLAIEGSALDDDVLNLKDENGRTLFSFAMAQGHPEIVRILLNRGKVDVDSKDDKGRTPLSYAVASSGTGDRPKIVELLLKTNQVDVDFLDEEGRTPFSYAAQWAERGTLELLLGTGNVEVDRADKQGKTPLIYAAWFADVEVVELLLATKQVDINSKDCTESTPLIYAAGRLYRPEIVKLLLETERVQVDSKDSGGNTALSWAAIRQQPEVVQLLLGTERVDVDSMDKKGRTPLSYAAAYCFSGVLRLLLGANKINVNSRDCSGCTPLSWAARYPESAWASVRDLLKIGKADPNIADHDGKTPLSWAQEAGCTGAAALLATKMHASSEATATF